MAGNDKGVALLTAVLMMMIFIAIGTVFISAMSTDLRISSNEKETLEAFYIAEAGIQKALYSLSQDSDGWNDKLDINNGNSPLFDGETLGLGSLTVNVADDNDDENPANDTNEIVLITSTGRARGARRVMRIEAGLFTPSGLFDRALFANGGIKLSSNARVDSYDSTEGPYGGENVGSTGDVGTNSTGTAPPYAVVLYGNSRIMGDALIGPGGDTEEAVKTFSNAEISGTPGTAEEARELPSYDTPSLPSQGLLALNSNEEATISGDGEYSSIALNNNSVLLIDRSVTLHVTGSFQLNNKARVDVAEGCKVDIYLSGSFNMNSNSRVNDLIKDPLQLAFYGTDAFTGDIDLSSNSRFYGGLFFPQSSILLSGSAVVYGALIAEDIEMSSNSRVHYDVALKESGEGGEGASGPKEFRVSSWREAY